MNPDDYMQDIDDQIISNVKTRFGPIAAELAQDKAAAYRHVNDPNPKARAAALALINLKWGITPEVADLCERLAVEDSDIEVRSAAVLCLNQYYRAKSNRKVIKLLATIVANEREMSNVRELAYCGVISLQEPDPLKWPRLGLGFTFPNDVDWSIVSRYL